MNSDFIFKKSQIQRRIQLLLMPKIYFKHILKLLIFIINQIKMQMRFNAHNNKRKKEKNFHNFLLLTLVKISAAYHNYIAYISYINLIEVRQMLIF